MGFWGVLGGSWVVISRVTGPLIWVMIIVTLLITPLISRGGDPGSVRERDGPGIRVALTKSAIEDFICSGLGVGVHALVRNDAKSELQKPAFAVGGNDAFLITLNPEPLKPKPLTP